MALTKIRLGDYIEPLENRNCNLKYGIDDVKGINNFKKMISTKADMMGRDFSKFYVVNPSEFVFNHRTSRNGGKFSITINYENRPYIFTEDYVVFRVKADCITKLNYIWLYLYFCRSEFDRYAITNSWGSSTEFYNWEDVCDINISLPPIEIQRKYVAVYNALVENQKAYEKGLDDLKLTCDAYIENLRRMMPCEKIGPYIRPCNERNNNNTVSLFQGINVDHVFTDPKRIAENAENGSVVRTGQFAFNKVMKAHNTKLPIALREGPDCVVSSSYQVFEVVDKEKILPKYLLLWMNRAETQRYAGFISFGTTRDIFTFDDMGEISIPLPDTKIQQNIVDAFKAYQMRCDINEKLKVQIKDICPLLIRGSLENGGC